MAQSKSHPQGSARKQGGGGKQSAHQKNPSVKQFRGLSTIPHGTANHQRGYRLLGSKTVFLKKIERVLTALHITGIDIKYLHKLPSLKILKQKKTWYYKLVTKQFSGFYSELMQFATPVFIEFKANQKPSVWERVKKALSTKSVQGN